MSWWIKYPLGIKRLRIRVCSSNESYAYTGLTEMWLIKKKKNKKTDGGWCILFSSYNISQSQLINHSYNVDTIVLIELNSYLGDINGNGEYSEYSCIKKKIPFDNTIMIYIVLLVHYERENTTLLRNNVPAKYLFSVIV